MIIFLPTTSWVVEFFVSTGSFRQSIFRMISALGPSFISIIYSAVLNRRIHRFISHITGVPTLVSGDSVKLAMTKGSDS